MQSELSINNKPSVDITVRQGAMTVETDEMLPADSLSYTRRGQMRDKSGLALALSNIINSFSSDTVSAGRSGVKTTFVPPLTPVRGINTEAREPGRIRGWH